MELRSSKQQRCRSLRNGTGQQGSGSRAVHTRHAGSGQLGRTGSSPRQLTTAQLTAASIVDWLNSLLDAAGKSERTKESYAYVVQQFWRFLEAAQLPTELEHLRPKHFRAFFAAVRAEGASANTLANFDRTLRAVLKRVEQQGKEDFGLPRSWQSPLAAVEKHRPQKVQKHPLSAQQAKELLRRMPRKGFIAARNHAQVAFMLLTGARSLEVRHLQLTDLQLGQRIAVLRTTKGNKPRVVFLPTRLVRVLQLYLRRREKAVGSSSVLVFPTRNGTLQSRRALHRSVQAAGMRIGVSNLSPHRLRHSYVTLSHAKGAPLKFLQEQCGHSSVQVTQGYIELSAEQKQELAELFAAC